ncbi:MAG: T9SS type A sorting domain-containing protein [Ignavibacteriales bacterium]|nr:T9SS type A sorting domain-containing protein [Ignavibacteriales bacterium]
MNLLKKVSLVLALCALTVGVSLAQQSVVISGTDGSGSGSVTIGIHPAATGGIDAALGEYSLPPKGYAFDMRCFSMPRWDTLGSDGVRINYHKQYRIGQTDTFRIAFAPEFSGSPVTISWPADMAHVYGGFWRLLDDNGVELCDMTAQPNYVFQTESDAYVYFMIAKGDGLGFNTATVLALEQAVDSKGKGKAEKRKTVASEGEFSFTNSADSTDALYVEFSQEVNIATLDYDHFDKVTDLDGKKKKYTFEFTSGTQLLGPATVTVFAEGNKGKELVAKKYWWIPNVPPLKWKPTKLGPVNPNSGSSRLWLKMPNWNNVGEEVYGGPPPAFDPTLGLIVGLNTVASDSTVKGAPQYKFVNLPKWKDVNKSLIGKGSHLGGATTCFRFIGTKAVAKGSKGLTADKSKHELFAQIATLKFNVASSKYGHTNTGFGSLAYKAQAGDPSWVDGISVDSILAIADRYFSCFTTTATGTELNTIISRINGAFAGTFDTVSFGTKTVLKNAKILMNVSVLYRTSFATVEPITTPNYVESATPVEFKLNQNYPNPFNPTTTISFDLSADAFVTLKVYNMLGQEIATLIDREEYTEGSNDVEFDASALASGVYYYRLIVNDGEMQQVQKMMLLK